jgi:hypothetical protein
VIPPVQSRVFGSSSSSWHVLEVQGTGDDPEEAVEVDARRQRAAGPRLGSAGQPVNGSMRQRRVRRRRRQERHCARPVRLPKAVALVLAPRRQRLRQGPRAGRRVVRDGLLHQPDLRARRGGGVRVGLGRRQRQAPAVARGPARPRRRAGLRRRAAAVPGQVVLPRPPRRVRRQGQELLAAPQRRRARGGGRIAGRGGVVGARRGDDGGGDGAVVGGLHVRHLPRAEPADGAHLRRPRRGGRRRELAAADQSAGARGGGGRLEPVIRPWRDWPH